jgi:hypothetical protein
MDWLERERERERERKSLCACAWMHACQGKTVIALIFFHNYRLKFWWILVWIYSYMYMDETLNLYRVYQKEYQDFTHLQLRNENRYDDARTCSLIVNSVSSTQVVCIPTAVNSSFDRVSCTSVQCLLHRRKYGLYRSTQNFNLLFEFNMNLRVSMVWDHLMTRALGDGTSNTERMAVSRKRHSTWQPWRSGEDLDHVRQAFIQSLKKSITLTSALLQLLQMTVHRILQKILCVKPYKLQVVQKFAVRDKQLRS